MRTVLRAARHYLLIGLLTATPLIVTWWITSILFHLLSDVGTPLVLGLAEGIRPTYPTLAELMVHDVFMSIAAALTVLSVLLVLGWSAGHVVGRRIIELFEILITRIPLVNQIYRACKQFLGLAESSSREQRVVLIEFPSPDMKALGLLTAKLHDKETGNPLAAVYVPTAPNPTSGYIQIVPLQSVIVTDWTFDQAMSFVLTGGSSAPDHVRYRHALYFEEPKAPG